MFVAIIQNWRAGHEFYGPFTSAEVERFMEERRFKQINPDEYKFWWNEEEELSAVVHRLIKPE